MIRRATLNATTRTLGFLGVAMRTRRLFILVSATLLVATCLSAWFFVLPPGRCPPIPGGGPMWLLKAQLKYGAAERAAVAAIELAGRADAGRTSSSDANEITETCLRLQRSASPSQWSVAYARLVERLAVRHGLSEPFFVRYAAGSLRLAPVIYCDPGEIGMARVWIEKPQPRCIRDGLLLPWLLAFDSLEVVVGGQAYAVGAHERGSIVVADDLQAVKEFRSGVGVPCEELAKAGIVTVRARYYLWRSYPYRSYGPLTEEWTVRGAEAIAGCK